MKCHGRVLWSLVIGLGLTLGLSSAFALYPVARVHAVRPDFVAEPGESTIQRPAVGPQSPEASHLRALARPAAVQPGPPTLGVPRDGVRPLAPPMPGVTDLAICLDSRRVWGIVGAGETVTVTVNGAQMGAARANNLGFFWTTLYDANGNRPGLGAGDTVAIYHDGIQNASITLRDITGQVDVVNDVISGVIGGSGLPISVTVYAPAGEPSMTSYSQTVSTDGAGNFTADFSGVWDFVIWDEATVAYVDGPVEVHQHVYAAESLLVRPWPFNGVMGFTAPGAAVTATLYLSDTTEKASAGLTANAAGWYYWGVPDDVLESDYVVVEFEGGTVMSRTVDALSVNVDAANNRVTGVAEPGAVVRGRPWGGVLTPLGRRETQASTTADPTGVYTLEFGAAGDIMPGQWFGVFVADAEGDDLNTWHHAPSVDVNQTTNEVSGYAVSPPGPLSNNWPVTLTLYSAADDTTYAYSKGMGWYGWYWFGGDDGLPDIAPGDVVTVESAGFAWQGVVQVMTMTVEADPDADRFTGEVVSPTGRVELSGHYWQGQLYPAGGQLDMLVTATSPFTAAPAGFDVNGDLSYDVAHRTTGEYVERVSRRTDGFGITLNSSGFGGVLNPPGVAYTFTLYNSGGSLKTQVTGNSPESDGNLGWIDFGGTGQRVEVGDYVQMQSAAGFSHTVQIPALSINGDPDADIVYGQGPANTLLYVRVGQPWNNPPYQGFVPTDESGRFTVTLGQLQQVWGNGDLQWGDELVLTYYDEKNTWLNIGFSWPQITARFDMQGVSDIFGHNAIPGNTIYVTVTHPVSGVIFSGTTSVGTGWEEPNGYWLNVPNDSLTPGNTVTVDFGEYEGSAYVDSVEVVTLTGQADVDYDIVTGAAPAEGWVSGWCEDVWGNRGPHLGVEVDASGVYTLDFGSQGWDVQYGDSYHIYYAASHGHQVEYVFWLPAPEVGVWKGTVGGFARPGGKYVYQIVYWNDGNGVATDTLIVDTLPLSTTYAGDTSGVTPEIGANGVITWHLGNLPPPGNGDNWGVFAVTVDVADTIPDGGSLSPNCVTISTSAPGDSDPGNDTSCAGPVDVWDSDVGVNIDKWPNPGDPTPGQEFEYHFRWCTDRGAGFGPVWLTDTLPVSTTLLDWWTDWPWNMWTEVITTGGQFALYAPGLPGDYCQQTYLRLLLDPDVPLGTLLQNTIVITTPGDVDPNNNARTVNYSFARPPRYDMNTDKWFSNGVLVPGGWIRYGANWWNAGNTAAHAWLTDTLPPGTSYQSGSGWHHDNYRFEPATVTDEYAVWDLDVVGVSQGRGLDFSLDIGDTVPPGTVLTNCVTVGTAEAEDTPWDNTACITETINEPGPNLRVRKESWWNGDGQLGYRVQFENIGNQQIDDVWITDTLPADTAWDGWWNLGFDWGRLAEQSLNSDVLAWRFSELYPGDSGNIEFNANLAAPGAPLRWYTNTVEIAPLANDTDPTDNTYTDVAFSGGEVQWVDFDVYRARVWGCAPQGPVTVTTALAQMTFGDACWNENNFPDTFDPGDVVTITAGAGTHPVVVAIPDPFTGYASSITDTVWGQIGGAGGQQVEINLWDHAVRNVPADGDGHYSFTFPDVPRGGQGDVNYYTTIDYAHVGFHHHFQTPDLTLWINCNSGHVLGPYELGHTVWLTITDNGGAVKATAVVSTVPDIGWGSTPGFSAQGNAWSPANPEILADDWVYGRVDNGNAASARVGVITGAVDVDNDSISGRIYAPWFTQTLSVDCHPWGAPGGVPSKQSTAGPNGDPPYFCRWTEWDVQPGQDIGVWYNSDGNWVGDGFHAPAPRLRVEKWLDGGNPGEGGNAIFYVQYRNEGDGDAENVVITDTLQGMTYITDTSGFAHTGSGGQVVLDLGTVAPGDWIHFYVFAEVNAAAGERVTNTVAIATSNPYDQGDEWEKHSEWSGEVQPNDARLNIGTWPWTGDPAAGYDVVFHVNACNNGGTGSTQVTLTDTLHPALTLQSWWADNPGWVEMSRAPQQLVLARSTLPGWRCEGVYVRATVDAGVWQGMELWNQAVIHAANDLSADDNEAWWWGNVNNPHTNLNIDKYLNWGQLTPGGELRYRINTHNNGNVPVGAFRITDTLPVSTTFVAAWTYDQTGRHPFAPAFIGDGVVAWEIAGLDNAYRVDFEVVVRVAHDARPGAVLVNTAEVMRLPGEDTYEDNVSSWTETLNPTGPNLRVTKRHEWHGDGQLGYRIYFYNLGDETITDVWITDTLPADTDWDGWWNLGFDWGRLAEQSLTGDVLAWRFSELYPGDSGNIEFNANLAAPGTPLRWYTNTVEIAPLANDTDPTDNTYTDVAFSGGEVQWVDFDVYRTRVWGCAPQAPITVTTALAEMTFWDACWNENNFPDTFDPGDIITVTAGAGLHPVVVTIPDPFTGQISSVNDTVWGQIGGLDHQRVQVDLWGFPSQWVTTDAQGYYSLAYPADIPHGAQGDLGYWAEIDYARVGFHHRLVNLDLSLNINYDHDWVEREYEGGHTVWITVTNDLGVIRATAELTTGVIPWWGGGQTGFSTNLNDPWQPHRPDIRPGDWVYGATETGYTATVQLGLITGVVDVDADRITGTVNAPWLMPGPVDVECHTWGAPGGAPNKRDSVIPDGNDIYTCAWDPNTEWDVWPWQDIGVSYREPDGHQIFAVFRASAPRLRVEKWWEGGGNPAEGGNAIFYVQYRNEGDGDAENVVITDTLQGMTFITDTSGFAHTGSGGQVVWNLGTLAPGDWIHFYVYAEVNATAGERVTNTVAIATSNPYDQGDEWEKHSEWSGEVQPNDAHLNVGKGAWTNDPAPGTDFVYNINVCNNGSTASSQVTLTDTLHLSTTLRSWWTREPGWTEMYRDDHTLVLSRPTIPAWQCYEVYVRVHLDENAWPGMSLSNTAAIAAAGDLEDNDNEATWWGNVNHPRINLNIHKGWDWGQLTPGGELHYNINYQNTGNVPVAGPIRITDTLPISTTFTGISNFYGGPSVTPLFTGTDYVVFEIAGLDNGYSGGFQVALRVDSAALPGALLTNTVEIEPQPDEDNTDDNIHTAVETLYPHGPNLRVTKWGDWHGDRAGHAWYQMVVENVGDEPLTGNVTLTDTYPTVMNLDGGVGIEGYAGWWEWLDHPAEHYFTVTVEPLEPGRRARFNFNTQIPDPDAVPGGLILTNTVTVAPVAGDTHPADDRASYVLTTGPDLWIEKELVAGTLRPGELITFSLRFGNDRAGWQWWWQLHGNAVLTDTMPAGFEYVGALQHWCGWTEWCEHEPERREGQQAVWDLWPLHAEEWNELYVTFRITDTATGLDTFINRAEIASTEPVSDAEVYTGNNAAEYTVVVDLPYFQVSKVYESSRIAGTAVTYTLTVTNVGNAIATGVIVTDALPAHLTDHSGTAGLPWIGWWVKSIASGGAATLDFYATLPCTAGLSIVNADYGVRASDQGVTSAPGAPVSFDVIEPNITAALVRAPESIVAGETVYFTTTAGTNGTPLSYAWAFGDGATDGGSLTAWHVYTQAGVYTAIFTATDGCGYTGVATATVTVVPACNPVTSVSFTYAPANPAIRTAVVFTAAVTPTDAGAPVTYVWSFGDGAAGDGQAVNHTYALSDSYTVVVTATNCAGAGLATYTENVAVRLVEGSQAPVDPVTGGTLVYTDSQGNPTVVQIPGGAVSQAITLLLTPVVSPTQPASPGLRFAHHTFDLEAYLGYTLLSGFVFSRPFTVTIHYSNADVHGLDESDLRLYYWTGGAWSDVINTCTPPSSYTRDLLQNVLGVPLCHLTRFGVMSRALQNVYLPLVMRSY